VKYLLDTCVLSELARKQPHQAVIRFYNKTPVEAMFISVLTAGELKKGILKLRDSQKKKVLLHFYTSTLVEHQVNILTLGLDVSDCWASLQSSCPRTLPVIDSLLAATALHHDLTLVTRNEKDFDDTEVRIFNPWAEETLP
jgi:predicted nucleic acid-binding protein